MKLYHATTPKKAKKYKTTGAIKSPVRGFNTLKGAMFWCMKTGRTVIYEINVDIYNVHKLPDHHNKFGIAYWNDGDVNIENIKCIVSTNKGE
jgi:hypothetical protein